jgi:Fur family transcriptional regulator, iron response regulator
MSHYRIMEAPVHPGNSRSFALELLQSAGLRPTRQRLGLACVLFGKGNRHVTAEQLHSEALAAAIQVSLATVYNTLHQFIHAGLLRETIVEPGRSYFDTNIDNHHHFFNESNGMLHDIPGEDLGVLGLPPPPKGTEIRRVEVIIRVRQPDSQPTRPARSAQSNQLGLCPPPKFR